MGTKEIIAYLKDEHKIEVTGQTIRNWQKRGRGGVTLPGGATAIQVAAYLKKVGTELGRGRPRKA